MPGPAPAAPEPVAGAGRRRWYATARCTRGRCWPVSPRRSPAARTTRPSAGSCTWNGVSPGFTKPSRSRACAAIYAGSPSLPFCCSQVGDLMAQRGLGRGQLFHLGALREVGAYRTGDGQRQHTDHRGQHRRAPRGETQPLFGPLLDRFGDRSLDGFDDMLMQRPRRVAAGVGCGLRRLGRRSCATAPNRITGLPRARCRGAALRIGLADKLFQPILGPTRIAGNARSPA